MQGGVEHALLLFEEGEEVAAGRVLEEEDGGWVVGYLVEHGYGLDVDYAQGARFEACGECHVVWVSWDA